MLSWKAPISLVTQPKEAQFYARVNADDGWKHKYKEFCFTWTNGNTVVESAVADNRYASATFCKLKAQAEALAERVASQQTTAIRQQHDVQSQQQRMQQQATYEAATVLSAFACTPPRIGECDHSSAASSSSDGEATADAASLVVLSPPLVSSSGGPRKRGRPPSSNGGQRRREPKQQKPAKPTVQWCAREEW